MKKKTFYLLTFLIFVSCSITQKKIQQTSTNDSVRDIDGNVYKTVKIGNQWWMAENLKVTHYRNGDEIPHVTDDNVWFNLTLGAYCNYKNDSTNVSKYGRLYNWYAAVDSRQAVPDGWHVPTDEEWQETCGLFGWQ